jgi:hypothetical protein
VKLDDASWHSGAKDFPKALPPEAGSTHIGMFVTWMVINDLVSNEFKADWPDEIRRLMAKQITPGQFVWQYMDGQLSSVDLSEQGQRFAEAYYHPEIGDSYLKSYEATIKGDLPSEYLLPDTWQTFAKVSVVIDAAYQSWHGT